MTQVTSTHSTTIEIVLDEADTRQLRKRGFLALNDPTSNDKAILIQTGKRHTPGDEIEKGNQLSAVISVLGGDIGGLKGGESRTWNNAHERDDTTIELRYE